MEDSLVQRSVCAPSPGHHVAKSPMAKFQLILIYIYYILCMTKKRQQNMSCTKCQKGSNWKNQPIRHGTASINHLAATISSIWIWFWPLFTSLRNSRRPSDDVIIFWWHHKQFLAGEEQPRAGGHQTNTHLCFLFFQHECKICFLLNFIQQHRM